MRVINKTFWNYFFQEKLLQVHLEIHSLEEESLLFSHRLLSGRSRRGVMTVKAKPEQGCQQKDMVLSVLERDSCSSSEFFPRSPKYFIVNKCKVVKIQLRIVVKVEH